jgi:hypothetical protein
MIPFVGFLPDADEHMAGVLTDCEMLLPSMKGYKGAPSFVAATTALAAACRGAAYVVKLDNTTRLFSGTQTALYEWDGSAWVDVSKVGGYTGSNDSAWRFAMFGDVAIAVNLTDATQKSVSTGAFSDLSGAPKAKVVEIVSDGINSPFVMLGNYNDGSAVQDGIFWSAKADYTDWTPDVATGCGNLRLYDSPGEITAIKRLGSSPVVYKAGGMWVGSFNPSSLWGFNQVSSDIGTPTQEAVVSIETAHFFIGKSDIYMFDGARPVPIGDGIKEWFFNDLNTNFAYKIRGHYDRANSLIYWYYPSTSSTGGLNSCIVYNHKTGKWGRANRDIEVCLEYLTGTFTYASLESAYSTYDVIPNVTYGSPFWTTASPNAAIFTTSHLLGTLTGETASCSLTTGAIGDDAQMTMVSRVQPRFLNDPTSGSMTNYYRMTDGSAYTTDAVSTLSSGRFDVLREARWHKFKLDFTGATELNGNSYLLVPAGYE